MKKTKQINIFSENIHEQFKIDKKKAIEVAKKLLNDFLNTKNVSENSCLNSLDFDCLSFDILYCDNTKTHEINKVYRQKDAPADIITFAIFADSEEKFILDGEINLGEIIISLDKVAENAIEKGSTSTKELYFLISHGIMHLLGFDHQTIEEYNFMVDAQNIALSKIKE